MTDEVKVTKRADSWLEVPSLLGDGSGYMPGPVELRPGSTDDSVILTFEHGTPGREVKIEALRDALDAVEKEARS